MLLIPATSLGSYLLGPSFLFPLCAVQPVLRRVLLCSPYTHVLSVYVLTVVAHQSCLDIRGEVDNRTRHICGNQAANVDKLLMHVHRKPWLLAMKSVPCCITIMT